MFKNPRPCRMGLMHLEAETLLCINQTFKGLLIYVPIFKKSLLKRLKSGNGTLFEALDRTILPFYCSVK